MENPVEQIIDLVRKGYTVELAPWFSGVSGLKILVEGDGLTARRSIRAEDVDEHALATTLEDFQHEIEALDRERGGVPSAGAPVEGA